MAKFPYPPDQDGFQVIRGPTTKSVQLDGGAPRVRRDQLGTWARVPVQWTCGPAAYEDIQDFYDTELIEGSLPFTIDLYMKLSTLTEHKAIFVPETFKLAKQEGLTFVVQAEIWAKTTPEIPV